MPAQEKTLNALQEAIGDKYDVLEWIGGGGMAEVYLARHRLTGGLFAVKVLAEWLAHDESIVNRFLQEARTAAALSGHPNIVGIFDVGRRGSLHYIIMQYVEGEDLKSMLARRGKLPAAEAAALMEQVAEALVQAAAHRVVHRDLKPSNVLVDRRGRAVVLDFGIAKAGETPSVMTAAGERVGTPYYMSPEHFREGRCDHRSDLYSLGVVFFELLTGVRPFGGDTLRAIESEHLSKPAPSPCELEPSIPAQYGGIVARLLEKRPEDRYASAAELLADLRTARGAIELPPVPAPPPAPHREEPPAVRRSRLPWLLAAIAILAGIGVGAFLLRLGGGAVALPASLETSTGPMTLLAGEPALYIDAADVTNATYKAFCDQTGYPLPSGNQEYFFEKPAESVLNLAPEDAAAFAKWAGKRVPTVEEWERARRGSYPFSTGRSTTGFRCVKDAR